MRKNMFAVSGLLATVLGLASGATAWSQPADSPVERQVQSPKSEEGPHGSIIIGFDLLTKRFMVKVETTKSEPPAPLDAVTPTFVPAIVDELLRQAREAFSGTPPTENAIANDREKQAIHLFKIAERCRQKGDYEMARTCYQQVHMLTPTSRFGRLAIDRLSEVEQRLRETAEEQDVPEDADNHDQTYRDIRQNSIPLGLVEVTY